MSITCILTDIEGTTSSIDFVHSVLFPYASEKLEEFVNAEQHTPEIRSILEQARQMAGMPNADLKATIATLRAWIEQDKKVAPLKDLQGHIWKHGYINGDFTGHIYDDAARLLHRWSEGGIPMFVYSSGSVQAQQLLFGYSDAGDLRPLISGYFDTRVGQKREPSSYTEIASMTGFPPANILFLSDVAEELDAAQEAGMQTVQLVRDENVVVGKHRTAQDFTGVMI